MVSKEQILEALQKITDIEAGGDIVSRNRVQDIEIKDTTVKVVLQLPTKDRQAKFAIEDRVHEVLDGIGGVTEVMVITRGAETLEPAIQPAGDHGHTHEHGHECGHGHEHEHAHAQPPSPVPLPGVKNIIAVASGKGGVGKSTVCVNLALALRDRGARVGLLDADIYGPSLKVLLDVKGHPQPGKQKEVRPVEQHGLKLMSLSFLTDDGAPVIWRGPIVSGLTKKFLQDVEWDELDYLLVDLPPGTGDTQLTLMQTVPITGAIIVTTPSHLALVDAEKGLRMFVELNVPVLGIIENMSYFICPHCNESTDVFDRGGGLKTSQRLNTAFLGEIPLDAALRETGDRGKPIMLANPASPISKAFLDLAGTIMASCPVA